MPKAQFAPAVNGHLWPERSIATQRCRFLVKFEAALDLDGDSLRYRMAKCLFLVTNRVFKVAPFSVSSGDNLQNISVLPGTV